ncbi:MAG TPA: hypothetical protein VK900_21490 [Anaerolineales bacterium]|nr:hypothetical protein [Anaerolineales bacterium]
MGNISNVSGEVNLAGRDIIKHESSSGVSAAELRNIFLDLYRDIDGHPAASRTINEDVKAEVKQIEATVTESVQKNEKVDEGFLAQRFRNIARVAPDILDVVVAMLANPLAGLGIAVKKIAEKAKEQVK